MKEKFEHKLTNRIREVFGNQPVRYNPQDWEDLKPRLTENRRKFPLFRIFAQAAAILLLMAAGTFFILNELNNDRIQNTVTQSGSSVTPGIDSIPEKADDSDINENVPAKPAIPVVQKALPNHEPDQLITSTHLVRDTQEAFHQEPLDRAEEVNKEAEMAKFVIADESQPEITNAPEQALVRVETESMAVHPGNDETGFSENIPVPANERERQKIKLGVEMASFTNFSQEPLTPGVNYGGGIIANIPVTSKLSLNPALVFTAYSLNFDRTEQRIESTGYTTLGVQEIIESEPDLVPAGINLAGIDIPVNLQYRFLQSRRSDYTVEIGISSLVYLSEKYSYSFTRVLGPNPYTGTPEEESVTGNTSESAFETFDFAKLINFSLGWNYNLNRRFGMSLNPYVKYPVGSLGSGEVKFGSGGLRMKLMVRPGKN